MLVKLLRPNDGHESGELVDMTPMDALKLITAGIAEICEEKAIQAPENKALGVRASKRQRI